jgi:L-lactate dehydrogenase (cytochrome)
MKLEKCRNVADLRLRARATLPPALFHFIEGGAEDEVTLRRNTGSFDNYELLPRHLTDVSGISMETEVLGQRIRAPLILAPTGMSRLFHHDGETAVVKAAGDAGIFYSLSTMSTVSLEDVAKAASGPIMFQLYVHRDRELTRELVGRAKAAGFNAACVTIDTAVLGNRERDLATGLTVPPRLTLKTLLGFASRPGWAFNNLTRPRLSLPNVEHRVDAISKGASTVIGYVNSQFDPSVTWADVEKTAAEWGGPFAVKGIMSATDAVRAVDHGASAVIVSNHGGRQLDGASASVDLLAEVVDAVAGRAEVILDGGVRRGTHVLKALALGAKACMMGRPYLWALAAGGEAGVRHFTGLLTREIERDMALLGCRTIDEISRDYIRHRAPGWPANY